MGAFSFPFPEASTVADVAPMQQFAAALEPILAALIAAMPIKVATENRAAPLGAGAAARERSDGLVLAIDLPLELLQALASLRLGGDFVAGAGAASAASIRRADAAMLAALCEAADSAWPVAATSWHAAAQQPDGARHDLSIAADDTLPPIGIIVQRGSARVESEPGPRSDMAWQRGMRALLGGTALPLRAVLHERLIPLADAIALRPGDVLPIETPREVQLRIGTHRLARASIAPPDDDGTLVVTIRQRRSLAMLAGEQP